MAYRIGRLVLVGGISRVGASAAKLSAFESRLNNRKPRKLLDPYRHRVELSRVETLDSFPVARVAQAPVRASRSTCRQPPRRSRFDGDGIVGDEMCLRVHFFRHQSSATALGIEIGVISTSFASW